MIFAAPKALSTPTDLPDDAVTEICNALNRLIADGIVVWMKTKNFHWAVVGPHFRDYHLLFDEQAGAIYDSIDPLAERVRKLGRSTIHSLAHTLSLHSIAEDERELVSSQEMIGELLTDNRAMAEALRSAIKICSKYGDGGSENLLQDLLDGTERRIWFLFSILQNE